MFNNNGQMPLTASPLYVRNQRNLQNLSSSLSSNLSYNNPQEVELMMKQKFNQPYFQAQQNYQKNYETDPYIELQQILGSCSSTVKQRIMNDNNYKACDNECEQLIKQAIEEIMIPQVLMTSQGRIAFEKFVGVVKKLKEKYSEEEVETTQKLQTLMQDEIVKKRLKELMNDTNNSINNQNINID